MLPSMEFTGLVTEIVAEEFNYLKASVFINSHVLDPGTWLHNFGNAVKSIIYKDYKYNSW